MIKNYQTALLTGASHGIGPFIAKALAKQGMNLVLAARTQAELEQVAADIRATGVQVLTVPTDVTDREARSALVHIAERTFGSVDVLVNNAGGDLQREFHHYTAAEVEAQIGLNLTGPIELTRLLLPGMLQRKQGHIINISSMGGRIGFPYTEVYSAAKDGLIGFTRVLRAVFLLREVFEYDFNEIATMLGNSEAACRRSFSRAKLHLKEHRPRFPASPETHRQLLGSYLQAVESGEMTPLMNLLAEDVTLWADAGGKIKQAALRPITGRDAVARFSLGTARFLPEDYHVEMAEVNGQSALIFRAGEQPLLVLTIEVEADHIQAICVIANQEKLTHIESAN